MFIENLTIIRNEHLKNRFYKLIINSKKINKHAKPGQFLHLKINNYSLSPLLRRPFSIYNIENNEQISILYEVIGTGTNLLSQKKKGNIINSHGPLGNGFSENLGSKKAILVGGGIGIAPLLFLAKRLKNKTDQIKIILGYRSKKDVIGEYNFKTLGFRPLITTNDGSYGMKSYVDTPLKKLLTKKSKVFACGPMPMLYKIAELCNEKEIPSELSVHNYIACGFGSCLGCAFPTNKGYKLVCKNGPIFNGKDLISKKKIYICK